YNYNHLNDITIGYNRKMEQNVNIYSAFLQNEWRTDRWGILIGGRLDKHSMVHNVIFSPRANLRFNPSEHVNLRLTYSSGFRAPQAYDEDMHIAIVGGERVVTVLAPNLKQESSNSLSASADLYYTFGSVQTNFLVEAFYTDLRDVFVLRQLDHTDGEGNAVLERCNGSGAKVIGINVEAKAGFSSKLQAQVGITLQRSRYDKLTLWSDNPDVPGVRRMFRTPDAYGYLTVSYLPIRPLNISLSATYSGNMLVQHLEGSGTDIDKAVTTPSFFDANLKVSYDFKIFHYSTLRLSLGMQNIFNSYQRDFDCGPLRDSGYIYGPTHPRSLFTGISLTI
ncbi:MAG: TonB-dependent receptor, partial [Muribaculaceae bacterium]|nr:TonB-dependent receptor [Muribaculaceae bacterium]